MKQLLVFNNVGALDNFPGNRALFKYKQKITGSTGVFDTKAAQIVVWLTCLSNFWRTLEMPLITCEINFILTWSTNCVISSAAVNQNTTFLIIYKKHYVPVVTLLTNYNAELLQ